MGVELGQEPWRCSVGCSCPSWWLWNTVLLRGTVRLGLGRTPPEAGSDVCDGHGLSQAVCLPGHISVLVASFFPEKLALFRNTLSRVPWAGYLTQLHPERVAVGFRGLPRAKSSDSAGHIALLQSVVEALFRGCLHCVCVWDFQFLEEVSKRFSSLGSSFLLPSSALAGSPQ